MKHLLITDDDHFITKILKERFETAGYQVSVAYDGSETLKKLEKITPQVVILDLGLPDMSGVDVLKRIRSDPKVKNLPVVVVSNSYCFSGIVQSAWNAGATHFINKEDCDISHLISQIDELVEGRHHVKYPDDNSAGHKPLVLIADDDLVIHGVVEFFLHQAGLDVKSAINGNQAVQMIEASVPDVIIVDSSMPGIDGFHVVDIIKENPLLSNIPIIMMAHADDELTQKMMAEHGVVEYVVKPFNLNKLVDLVKEHVVISH